MRKKLKISDLKTNKGITPLYAMHMEQYKGGGMGTFDNPYTIAEYQSGRYKKCWVDTPTAVVWFADAYHNDEESYVGGTEFFSGNSGYCNSMNYYGSTDYNGTTCREYGYTYVKISVSRSIYGDNATGSKYTAWAYDQNGNIISEMCGYFLEPVSDWGRSSVEGSDTAIPSGIYEVVPYSSNKYPDNFEIHGVPGRSKILIHAGNDGNDTSGCLLPGSSMETDANGNPSVANSKINLGALRNFINTYGSGHATIDISL